MKKKNEKRYCPLCDKYTKYFTIKAYLPERYCSICKRDLGQACLERSLNLIELFNKPDL